MTSGVLTPTLGALVGAKSPVITVEQVGPDGNTSGGTKTDQQAYHGESISHGPQPS